MAVLGCRLLVLEIIILIIITSRPHLLNFLLGTGNKVLIKYIGIKYPGVEDFR